MSDARWDKDVDIRKGSKWHTGSESRKSSCERETPGLQDAPMRGHRHQEEGRSGRLCSWSIPGKRT